MLLGRRLVAGVLLSGALGCATAPVTATRPAVRTPVRTATPDEVLAAYDGYCRGIHSVSASGDLDVRDLRAGKSQRLAVRLVATRGGRLYLKGSVAVVTALEVVSDGERFWFQVPSKKKVWTGAAQVPPQEAGTDQAPYYALRPEDVTGALLPEPLDPGPDEALVFEADARTVSVAVARLRQGRWVVRRRVWMSRETLLPLRSRTFDERGEVASEASFGSFEGGLPRWLMLERPAEGYQASFRFSRSERNAAVPERAFTPRSPEGYEVVEVGSR